MNKYSGLYKHVLHVANSTNDSISSGSPYIFLDKTQNSLYVRFGINSSATTNPDSMSNKSTMQGISNISSVDLSAYMQQGILIPYIPLQRWVHVAIVVNTTINGSTIICYIDGDLSITKADGEKIKIDNNDITVNYKGLSIDQSGNLVIGGAPFDVNGNGFSGLISKFTTFNYDLNQYDIYKNYNEGPVDNLLAKLGLGMYGVRSPVYKL